MSGNGAVAFLYFLLVDGDPWGGGAGLVLLLIRKRWPSAQMQQAEPMAPPGSQAQLGSSAHPCPLAGAFMQHMDCTCTGQLWPSLATLASSPLCISTL